MKWTPRQALIVAMSIFVLAAACAADDPVVQTGDTGSTTSTIQEYAWAEEAQIWHDAMDPLLSEVGGSAWEYFWDPNVEFDYRPMTPWASVLYGANAYAFMQRLLPPGGHASTKTESIFVSTDGAITLNLLDWGPSGLDEGSLTERPAQLANISDPIGINGAERMVSAWTVTNWRERQPHRFELADQADAIAAAWIETWTNGQRGNLYGADAELIDTIAGIHLEGSADIANFVGETSAQWTIAITGDGIPEIYPLSFAYSRLDGLVFVVDGDDGDLCPGRTAIVLTVVDGQVTTEERYWQVDNARRCLITDDLPGGWWIGQNLHFDEPYCPIEDLDTQSGIITIDGVAIETHNSTRCLDTLIEWGIRRFAEAGLPLPVVATVTLTQYSEFCTDARGRTVLKAGTADVYLCFHEQEACAGDECSDFHLDPQHILLHELSHAWIAQNVTAPTRDDFTELVGLDTWADPDTAWADRALEHAAETMAWGLIDTPLSLHSIGNPDPADLPGRFQLLTGQPPLQPDPGPR